MSHVEFSQTRGWMAVVMGAAMAELGDEKIGHEPGVTAIPVGKGMDGNEPVMKPHRDLIGRKGTNLGPVLCVAQPGAELDMDPLRINADVFARLPGRTRPGPDIPEHPLVQLEDKTLGQDICATASARSSTTNAVTRTVGGARPCSAASRTSAASLPDMTSSPETSSQP